MHRTRNNIIAKLRSIVSSIRTFSSKRTRDTYHSKPCSDTTCRSEIEAVPYFKPTEVYLPGPLWDALNPTERFASVADLCAHVGDQLPIQVVKLIARDVLRGLENLNNTRGISHGDINPNNILLSPTDLRALISQLRSDTQTSLRPSELTMGNPFEKDAFIFPDTTAVFRLSSNDSRAESPCRPEYIDRQALQAPEALLDAPCNLSSDIWSLGCVIFELLTGEALFDPMFQTHELGISREESHIIQIIELFGEMPIDIIRAGRSSRRWFTEDGALRIDTTYYPISLDSVLERHIEKSDVSGATSFLETLLKLRPENRARPQDIIDHQWFSD
ncbi:kinase-like domain-containing protein [Crassisporium funariophilum]|nr:kinase-like domain-containing protein [Crassisporium funariophilum]